MSNGTFQLVHNSFTSWKLVLLSILFLNKVEQCFQLVHKQRTNWKPVLLFHFFLQAEEENLK